MERQPPAKGLFLDHRQDPITQRFNPLMTQSHEELKTRLASSCSDWSKFQEQDSFFWFVSDGTQVVGTAGIHSINRMMLTAEIGYGVLAAYRGRGFAGEIVRHLTSDAFQKTNLRKLIAFVHEENVPSRRVLEKHGYVLEGMLREHYLVNQLPANEAVYGILRREVI